jgi:quinoprotein glucose dehydrogenase
MLRATALAALALSAAAAAQEPAPYVPFIEPASPEAAAHQARIRLAPGLAVSLWAAEPQLANPVCLALDERGAVYVAESFRIQKGVYDVRDHMSWLDDDLASQSVAERVELLRKHLGPDLPAAVRERDRVRLLRDTDGDGLADSASVFADSFGLPETGIGAGLLVRRSPGGRELWFTDIPDVWRLRDGDEDGRAEDATSMSTGWGVRITFMGHDMHGLCLGPDGRIYWSIGDRGFSVTTGARDPRGLRDLSDFAGNPTSPGPRQQLHHPDTGAVLRCEPDGSGLEVVHIGLRNPQELAFDDFGDLFTGDNNCDAGDQARLVPIIEGGDSGWRQPVQWLDDRGPWGREKLWAPRFDGQAAALIPPIANIASGPSGLVHEPGTALPAFAHHFLLCDFTGGADSSHIWAFPVEQEGAWFRLGEVKDLESGVLATDCDFGPDGALYVSDWVEGWSGCNKGRIWRIRDEAQQQDPIAAEVRGLLGGDWTQRSVTELESLLGHADQRVRLQAQLELTTRGVPGADALEQAARHGSGLARLHGVWGLGIVARHSARGDTRDGLRLSGLARDEDPELRTQFFRVLEHATARALEGSLAATLERGLQDESPRVAAAAALAEGRLHVAGVDVKSAWASAAPRAASDPILRHAMARAAAGSASAAELISWAAEPSAELRLLAVLALRELGNPGVAAFLADESRPVALEAARAIHDLPLDAALPALAARITSLPPSEPDAGLPAAKEGGPAPHDDTDAFVRRVLNANDRLGETENARTLGAFAARSDQRAAHRRLAVDMLADWKLSPRRDRLLGFERVPRERDATLLPAIARQLLAAGLDRAEDEVATGWVRLAAASADTALGAPLAAILDDASRSLDLRVEALQALGTLAPPDLSAIVDRTLGDREARLRAEALDALDQLSPELAVPRALPLLDTGELPERRAAYAILGRAGPGPAEQRLQLELSRLQAELVPAELQLDLLLAAEARGGALAERVAARRAARRACLL